MLYPAAGGSDDWALGGAGIPYSYTIGRAYTVTRLLAIYEVMKWFKTIFNSELPDTGTHGFILPASYITQVGR